MRYLIWPMGMNYWWRGQKVGAKEEIAKCITQIANLHFANLPTQGKDHPMHRCRIDLVLVIAAWLGAAFGLRPVAAAAPVLQAGFGETDITPKLRGKPVYLAGFGHDRKATGILDPLKARAIVLEHGKTRLAIVSIDVIGFFHPHVALVRKQLPGFNYVLVSSTHNHEGPDTLGLWGPDLFASGVDPQYLKAVIKNIVKAVQAADASLRPVTARLGSVRAPELLHDAREPYVKHDEVVALEFRDPAKKKTCGLLVQWNCHPETLGGANTKISADFVGATVQYLQNRHHCPVVYLTGTVGGLMTSLHVKVKDAKGKLLADDTVEKTRRYGELIGGLAEKALVGARAVQLTPIQIRHREVFLPMDNPLYRAGWLLGVLERQAYLWTGDSAHAKPIQPKKAGKQRLCIRSEVAWLRLGELEAAAIPGEIYPELVLDKVQDPADAGADFPKAAIEPAIYKQMSGRYRMLIGLANDEIGYIIPKRQWDVEPPFCYKRKKAQYGEQNSLGPDTAPYLCEAFKDLVKGKKQTGRREK
jgi:hypothetical protein